MPYRAMYGWARGAVNDDMRGSAEREIEAPECPRCSGRLRQREGSDVRRLRGVTSPGCGQSSTGDALNLQ